MPDRENIVRHLRQDQAYPATREELYAECDNLSDFSKEDKGWFKEQLAKQPGKVYASADEVLADLNF